MSKHQEWKMVHLLYTYARRTGTGDRRVLTEQEPESVTLPADFGGIHYYNYDLNDLTAGRQRLAGELTKWAAHKDHRPFGVKALVDR